VLGLLKNKGFLLLEAMMAVAILSVGMTLTLRSFSTAINVVRVSQDMVIAGNLMEQKVFELENSPVLRPGKDKGDFGKDFDGYSWILETSELEDTDLNEVKLTVKWQSGKRSQSLNTVTYLASATENEEE